MVQKPGNLSAEDTRELRNSGCGQPVGRYTLLRRIAAGGMAEVYSARATAEPGFSKRVAIKKILPQYVHNERFISMLVDEAKITVALDHPSIAQVHELGHDGEDYFIVMEYVHGRPLNKLMQRVDERGLGAIPVEYACQIMGQVALGLHHAHAQVATDGSNRNIVHRDVSPQNILIAYDGPVKLIDFGIARAEGRINQTSAGVIKGKLRYLAPEIASGLDPDGRADIFCCGIVLFEMLTGEAMFAPKSDLEAIELATNARVKSPRARNRRVPKELDEIVMKALKRNRKDRYQTAKELYADLQRFLNQAYPAFVGSELGDFMEGMFALEIREDQQRDDLALRVAAEIAADPAPAPRPRPRGALPNLTGSQPSYKPLVTRVAIDGADGGGAMDVIPAGQSQPRLVPSGAGGSTLPPVDGPGALQEAEATVKAQNPFVLNAPTGLPTVKGAPSPRLRAETVAAKDALISPRQATIVNDPAMAVAEAPVPLPDERKWPVWVGGAALVSALVAAGVLLSAPPPAPETPPIAPIAAIEAPAELIEASAGLGTLVVDVVPVVPVSVTVGGLKRADRTLPPLVLTDVVPGVPQRITINADGYRSITISRTLEPGERLELALEMVAATATIELRGVKNGYRISSSVGRVDGHKIVDIPPDSRVHVKVARPGTSDFKTTVVVTEPRPITVKVPRPPSRPRGTLMVNTRPISTVYVDGRKRGRTPLKLKLTAGTHQVMLKGPDGRQIRIKRKVRPGRVTKFQFKW